MLTNPFKISPLFEWNWLAEKRVVVNQGGTSSGKTYNILKVLLTKCIIEPNIIVTVVGQDIPNLKAGPHRDVKNILYAEKFFKDAVASINGTDMQVKFHNGSLMEFKSYENGQDAKSGKRDYAFFNEANGLDYEVYQQIKIRTRKKIYIDYNSDVTFWVHLEVLTEDDSELIVSNYQHNYDVITNERFITQSVVDDILTYRKKWKETGSVFWENKWKVYGLGLTGKAEGLVLKDTELVDSFPERSMVKGLSFASDQGYNDPTTLVEVCFYDGCIYAKEIYYETLKDAVQVENDWQQLGIKKKSSIISDAAAKTSNEYLKRKGYNIIPSLKGADSVKHGLSLLNSYPLKIVKPSKNLWREVNTYKYKKINGIWQDTPKKGNDHLIDPIRYWALIYLQKGNRRRNRSATN